MRTLSSERFSAISCLSHTVDVARKTMVTRSHGLRRERRPHLLGHSRRGLKVAGNHPDEINHSKHDIDVARETFAQFALPEQVVTDNGPQFESAEVTEFLRVNGVKHIRVAPYHPASNGTAERMVQTLKRSLQASTGRGVPVRKRLADFVLRYRSTPHS